MRVLRLGAVLCSLLLVLPAGRAFSDVVPPPLSADPPADTSSSDGSGHFGRWTTDRFGLPAYRYEIDEQSSAIAPNSEMAGSRDGWHQIGNDHIVANAYNRGWVQLWSQDKLYHWINQPVASEKHYAGGYGYLRAGGTVLSTLYDDRPPDAQTERDFGMGYVRKRTSVPGADVEEFVYAPFGDAPVLLHDVTITNTSDAPVDASWFEYWDVNPAQIAEGPHRMGVQSPSYDPASRTLTADEISAGDTDPLTIYAAAVDAPVSGFDTDTGAFFGSGTRAAPQAVIADATSQSIALPETGLTANTSMFAFRSPVSVAAHASVTLRYAYGAAHRAQIPGILGSPGTLRSSEEAWRTSLPQASFPDAGPALGRELQWDAYMVRSGATYEEKCGHHVISQGGYYQYDNGFQGAFRDPLQHMLPMIYEDPSLAREVLQYSAHEQPSAGGAVPYAMIPNCNRFDLGSSDDLDFWLLLAAAEYAMATRDFTFFDTREPYFDTGTASMWDHLKLSYLHQEVIVGRGPHGGYLTGATGDWSDFETETEQMTESMLVTAQLAYAYPVLAEVADHLGDQLFAAQLRLSAAVNVATLRQEWTGKGWISRGYSGAVQLGSGAMNEEPQPWAMLAGALTPDRIRTLMGNIHRFLRGEGAPNGPSRIGSAQSPGRDDPDVTEHGIVPQDNAVWVGGVWYALNGALAWATAGVDESFAWDELMRNTLIRHADEFPDHWDGILSVDDVCHAWYTPASPERCGTGLSSAYLGQIMHQPAWSLFDAITLAGLVPTADGYRIDPHVPSPTYSMRTPLAGIAREAGRMRGYVRPERTGAMTIEVVLPAGVSAVQAWAQGAPVASVVEDGIARFTLPAVAHDASDWAVTY